MTTTTTNHILLDERGVAWIDQTNVKVIEVATEFKAYQLTPEQMHLQHPDMSVAQLYAAMAYYYDHKSQFDAQIEANEREYERLRAESLDSPGRQKLRKLGLI